MSKKKKIKEKIQEEETLLKDENQEEILQEEESFDEEEVVNEEVDNRVQELEDKIKELEDQYLRANAEFENMRKRLEKEKSQAVAYANEQFARDLLCVIDALESGASSISDDENFSDEAIKNLKEGIDLTIEQFSKVFEKNGISLVDMECGFNPHFHEAVMKVDSQDHKEGEIVQVYQKGYQMRDRVLRPAMVTVAK